MESSLLYYPLINQFSNFLLYLIPIYFLRKAKGCYKDIKDVRRKNDTYSLRLLLLFSYYPFSLPFSLFTQPSFRQERKILFKDFQILSLKIYIIYLKFKDKKCYFSTRILFMYILLMLHNKMDEVYGFCGFSIISFLSTVFTSQAKKCPLKWKKWMNKGLMKRTRPSHGICCIELLLNINEFSIVLRKFPWKGLHFVSYVIRTVQSGLLEVLERPNHLPCGLWYQFSSFFVSSQVA